MNNPWISVKDKLPEDYVSCFIYGSTIRVSIGYYSAGFEADEHNEKMDPYYHVGESTTLTVDKITHWQPLEYPLPPEV